MLNFAEEIILLNLDDVSGEFKELPPAAMGFALAGAILMDLALQDRIDTDVRDLVVIHPEPTGDPVLDETLARLGPAGPSRPIRDCLDAIAARGPEIRERILAGLVKKGVLRCEECKFLWVFATRRYPSRDQVERKEIRTRLRELILSRDVPDSRDVVLISLLHACRLFGEIFTQAELAQAQPRIVALARLDLIGQAMTRIIREIEYELNLVLGHVGF